MWGEAWWVGGLWVVVGGCGRLWVDLALASQRRRMPRALYVFKCEAGSATPPQNAPKSTLTLILCTSIFLLFLYSCFFRYFCFARKLRFCIFSMALHLDVVLAYFLCVGGRVYVCVCGAFVAVLQCNFPDPHPLPFCVWIKQVFISSSQRKCGPCCCSAKKWKLLKNGPGWGDNWRKILGKMGWQTVAAFTVAVAAEVGFCATLWHMANWWQRQ